VYTTARALHFNKRRLKQRMVARTRASSPLTRGSEKRRRSPRSEVSAAGGHFIALELPAANGRTVIDLVGRHGDRMRVELGADVDVGALLERLWNRAP
jgi:hypothetical protein